MPRIVVLLLALVLAACAGAPSREPPPESARAAEAMYRDGDFANAAGYFLAAAQEQRSRANYYRLRAAESWRELGDLDAARRVVDDVDARRLGDTELLRLELLLAELALAEGDAAGASSWLTRDAATVPDDYRARFHELRAQSLAQTDPFAAAVERARLQPLLSPSERGDNARRVDALLASVPDGVLAERTAALPAGDALYPFAGRALSQRGLPLPRPYERTSAIRPGAPRPPADADGYRPPLRVGLILPQDGALGAAGAAVRDGFFAAYYDEPRRRPLVTLYDAAGTPESAVAAYRTAVQDGVDAVVGPLSREAVAALYEQPEVPVPLLALNRGGAVPPPPGSASFALAPEDEAIAIAERLWRSGAQRVLVIAGADDSGERATAAFNDRFVARGGEVVAVARLPTDGADYGPVLRGALDTAAGATGRAARQGGDATAFDPAYDAIFLAVRAGEARLLMPQLRNAGVLDVPMLATSSANALDGNARLDRELDGLVVAEIPWLVGGVTGVPTHDALARQLDSARGPAARLFAFGMDAYRLLAYLDYLQRPDTALRGATGTLTLDGFGQVQREPAFARFSGGRLQAMSPGYGSGLEDRLRSPGDWREGPRPDSNDRSGAREESDASGWRRVDEGAGTR